MPGDDSLMVEARAALLDAVAALDAHLDSLILIGAQAIYLRTGKATSALAEATKDSDLAIDPRTLGEDPRLEQAMTEAGFIFNPVSKQPGAWMSPNGIPVDFMVPEHLAGTGSRRGVRIPPHSKHSARRAAGLEAAVIDHSPMTVESLDGDDRSAVINIAGPPRSSWQSSTSWASGSALPIDSTTKTYTTSIDCWLQPRPATSQRPCSAYARMRSPTRRPPKR